MKPVRPQYAVRRTATLVGLLAGFAVVLIRLLNLQVLQAAELTQRADRQHWKSVSLEGPRGTIYDRNGKVLAINVEVPSAFGVVLMRRCLRS